MAETGWHRTDPSLAHLAAAAGILLILALPLGAQSDSFHDLGDEGTIVDPFHELLTDPGPSTGFPVGETIPTDTLIAYCADSEGCRAQLVLTVGPFNPSLVNSRPDIVTRTLFVTPDGDRWILFGSNDTFGGSGSKSDAGLFTLMEAVSDGNSRCTFKENPFLTFVVYYLEVELGDLDATESTTATCRLIISD